MNNASEPPQTIPKLNLFALDNALDTNNHKNMYIPSNDDDLEEEIKDKIHTLEDSPINKKSSHAMFLQPIVKRFSSNMSPLSKFHSDSIKKPLSKENTLKYADMQKHSRKSVLTNLEDFLSNFSHNLIRDNDDIDLDIPSNKQIKDEMIEERKQLSRQNLYEYLQEYMKIDLDDDNDNENENGFGINEDEEKEKIHRELNDIPALYKQKYKSKIMKEGYFLQVAKMNEIEKLKVDYTLYPDNLPFLFIRRNFLVFCKRISLFAKTIVSSKSFQFLSILMILLNALTYSLISNRSNKYEQYKDIIQLAHDFFLFFYIVEMALKIFGYGIFLHYNSYFRDGWNLLDFMVIVTLVVTYTDIKTLDISLLRLLRLLKPFKTSSHYGQFQIIITALFSALPLLFIAFAMLIFFYLFYAIAGLQIFTGILKQRCYQDITGLIYYDDEGNDYLCGNLKCQKGYSCGKIILSPYLDVMNFDNIFYSVLQTLLIVTMDNWTTIMYNVQKVFSNFAWIYFVSLVIIGNYFLISLTLAVIKVKFSETHKILTDALIVSRKSMKGRTYLELAELKKQGTWDSRKIKQKFRKNDPNKSMLSMLDIFKKIKIFCFSYYRGYKRRVKKSSELQKQPSVNVSDHSANSATVSRSKIFDLGSRFLKFFLVGKKTLLRVKSNRIDEETDPNYLKIRVNHELNYESPSKYDVLETLLINEELILKKKRRFVGKNQPKAVLNLKKNDNYFVDFLSYISKKKKVKIKTIKKTLFAINYEKSRGTSPGTERNLNNDLTSANAGTKKSFSDYMETENPATPKGLNRKKTLALKSTSRLEQTSSIKKSMVAQIEENEAFVLSYKRNSGRNSYRSFSKMSQSAISFPYGSRIRDSSPNANLHIFSKLRLNKSFKITDSEYMFLKEFICAPIENEDYLEKNKFIEGDINFKEKYDEIMFPKSEEQVRSKMVWSGQDILGKYNLDHMEKILMALNLDELNKFLEESKFKFKIVREKVRILLEYFLSENLMSYAVLCYIILLAAEGIIEDVTYDNLDLIFTIVFTFEILLKFIAYGIKGYLINNGNQIDLVIIIISFIQVMIMTTSTQLLKYIRFLTAFKVLRIMRLFRKSKFTKFIFSIITQAISSFVYLLALLMLFNFVYALIGMQLFGGSFKPNDVVTNNFNFDTFWISFITVFDIITLDNWIDILALGFLSGQGKFLTAFFVISWIFLGYFVLLNLFLAILLDGFAEKLNEKDALIVQDEEFEDRSVTDPQEFKFLVDREAGEVILDELSKFKGENAKEFANNINIDRYTKKPSISSPANKRKNSYRSKTQIKSFANIYCANSFYLFSKSNNFRLFVYKIISHKYFDTYMIWVLCFSSLLLVFDTYLDKNSFTAAEDIFMRLSLGGNVILCSIFALEVFMKGITYGFILDKRSYMRNAWNVLDLFLSICYIIDILTPDDSSSHMIQAFKVMKIFRPLKFISINRNIRTVAQSLLKSAYAITNVFFLIVIVWLIFGILGIILFRDRFGYCDNKMNFGINKEMCLAENKQWIVDINNFNNIFKASLTLFVVGSLDGWSAIMYTAANSDVESKGPTQANNEYSSYIFFLSFIFFGQMFLVNLFIGVIFYEFSKEQRRSKHKFLDDSQIWWLKLQKKIILADPDFIYYKPPESNLRNRLFNIFNGNCYKIMINLLLLFDIAILSISFEDATNHYIDVLEIIHAILNFLFLCETGFKLYTLGTMNYFHHIWNKIEFFICCTIFIDLGMFFYYDTIFFSINYISRIIKASRIFKMIRVLRIIYKIKVIQKLLQTLKLSIPMVINISSLLMLTYYIYVLFGCHYFKNIKSGVIIDDYINFKNFSYALMTLFKVSTADSWENIMYDVMREYEWASVYFITFYLITTDLMINLFILTLITQFEESNQNSDNPLYSFTDNLSKFRKTWSTISKDPLGLVIHKRDIAKFFITLRKPLGFSKHEEYENIFKEIMLMHIPMDSRGYIFFNDILFATMKRVYFSKVIKNQTDFAKKKIIQHERKTLMKMEQKKKLYRGDHGKNKSMQNMKQMNPLSNFLYSRLSFTLWKKYTETTFHKLHNIDIKDFFESDSSDKENEYTFEMTESSHNSIEIDEIEGNDKKHHVSKQPTPSARKDKKNDIYLTVCNEFGKEVSEFVLPNGILEDYKS